MESVEAPSDVGQVLVLATSGGPHSADDWAAITTLKVMGLIELTPTTPLEIRNHVNRFEANVKCLARDTHDRMAGRERTALENHGSAYLAVPIDPSDLANQALASVMGFAGASILRKHYARSDVQAIVYQTFGQHLADNANVERRWFCDAHPDDPAAQAYLESGAPVDGSVHPDLSAQGGSLGTAQLQFLNPFID